MDQPTNEATGIGFNESLFEGIVFEDGIDSTSEVDESQVNESEINEEEQQDQVAESQQEEVSTTETAQSEEESAEVTTDEQAYINNHFEFMKEQGYLNLPEDYEFDGDLYKAYQADYENRQQNIVDGIINSLPEEVKSIVEYSIDGGTDVSKFVDILSKKADLSSIDLTNVDHAEAYMLNHLKQSLNEKYAKSVIEGMKDEDTLLEEFKQQYNRDQQSNQAAEQRLIQEQKQQIELQKEAQRQYIQNINQSIEEAQWTAQGKDFIKKEIYGGATEKKLQHIFSNDPNAFVQLARIIASYSQENGFQGVFDKKEKSKVIQETKNNFFRNAASRKGSSATKRKGKQVIQGPPSEPFDIEF